MKNIDVVEKIIALLDGQTIDEAKGTLSDVRRIIEITQRIDSKLAPQETIKGVLSLSQFIDNV
jgi:hypothetical protein